MQPGGEEHADVGHGEAYLPCPTARPDVVRSLAAVEGTATVLSQRQRRRDAARTRQGWDTYGPARPFQGLWVGLAVLLLLPGLVLTAMRLVPPTDDAPALVASFISYAVLTYLLSFGCFVVALLRARRRAVLGMLSGITAVLLVCHICWLAPLFRADHRQPRTDSFAVMTLNLLHGQADSGAVMQRARAADVVVLLEATDSSITDLDRYGWSERFPFSAGKPQQGAESTVVFSRLPMSEQASLSRSQAQQWIATVSVPQIGPVRVIAAHPCNPYCGQNRWHSEHQELADAAAANMGQPLLVAGDLNAVEDHKSMLVMRRDGLKSATDILGAGWLPTYPSGRSIPPLLPIDHILVNRFLTATSIERFEVAGTDHLGLMARIAGT